MYCERCYISMSEGPTDFFTCGKCGSMFDLREFSLRGRKRIKKNNENLHIWRQDREGDEYFSDADWQHFESDTDWQHFEQGLF